MAAKKGRAPGWAGMPGGPGAPLPYALFLDYLFLDYRILGLRILGLRILGLPILGLPILGLPILGLPTYSWIILGLHVVILGFHDFSPITTTLTRRMKGC